MPQDQWVVDLVEGLRKARRVDQVEAIIDRLEDHYDAFSGPGQEMLEDLLAQARRRLAELRG